MPDEIVEAVGMKQASLDRPAPTSYSIRPS